MSPRDLGLPRKFSSFRPQQVEALQVNLSSSCRFVAHSMPTGSGKSLAYMAHALKSGARTVILTSTKGLQDQLMRDFRSVGLVDIRGRANYSCRFCGGSCAEGVSAGCADAGTKKCPYTRACDAAVASRLVVTNYSYWIACNRYGGGLGEFQLLCLDEAHLAPDELASALAVDLRYSDLRELGLWHPRPGSPAGEWIRWARHNAWRFVRQDGEEDHAPDPVRVRAARVVEALATLATEEWVMTCREDGFLLEPVDVSGYAEEFLFRGIPRVVFYSAILVPKALSMLGVGDVVYRSYPYVFDPSRSPVYHVPTCHVNYRMGHAEIYKWVRRIDGIIGSRLDRRGIVHTVSYWLQKCLVQNSSFRPVMFRHEHASGLGSVVQAYRSSTPPAVLVSPSVSTGWDFPGDECRYQIVAKVPWPDISSPVLKARVSVDSEHSAYLAARTLVQATGRAMRSADDWCESFIVDDGIRQFVRCYRHLIPDWWMNLYRELSSVPSPPPV